MLTLTVYSHVTPTMQRAAADELDAVLAPDDRAVAYGFPRFFRAYTRLMSSRQDAFFAAVSARNIVRPSVRAVILEDGKTLVQTTTDGPTFYAFIGGEYEMGDTFVSRIRREIEEETNAKVRSSRYLCVVENNFTHDGRSVHGLDHFLLVEIDRHDVVSRERHLKQDWLPIQTLREYDLRPRAIRDAIADGSLWERRHFLLRDGALQSEP